jgi:hypothetical protein
MDEKEENMIEKINPQTNIEINKKNYNRIIMKCNREYLSFEKKNYDPKLEDYIPKWEWDIIAEEANCVIGNAYHLRKMEENVNIPKYMNLIFWIIFYFSIFDFLFLIIYTKQEKFDEIVIYMALALVLILCGVIIILMIYNYFRDLKNEKTIDKFIIEGMKEYINALNEIYTNIVSFKYHHNKLEIELTLLNKYHH